MPSSGFLCGCNVWAATRPKLVCCNKFSIQLYFIDENEVLESHGSTNVKQFGPKVEIGPHSGDDGERLLLKSWSK